MKTKYFYLSFGTAVISFLLLQSCVVKSKNVIAVRNFNGDKYLGKWYEIARFDYSFEKNMENTTAEYELNQVGIKTNQTSSKIQPRLVRACSSYPNQIMKLKITNSKL